jgi:hypothetical protein
MQERLRKFAPMLAENSEQILSEIRLVFAADGDFPGECNPGLLRNDGHVRFHGPRIEVREDSGRYSRTCGTW